MSNKDEVNTMPPIPAVKRQSAFRTVFSKSRVNILYIYTAGGIVIYALAHIFPEHSQEVFTASMVWLAGGIGIAKDMTTPDPEPTVPADLLSQSMDLHQQTLEFAISRKK